MNERLLPLNVAVIGAEIAIAWSDGRESYLPLQRLREGCPCAACCGEPDALGNVVKPEVRHTPASFELRGWSNVGGYSLAARMGRRPLDRALPFPYLRRLADAA